jgi:glycosyltransferase involved in cell wall biosynthesis
MGGTKLSVVIYIGQLALAGAELQVAELAKRLTERGHKVFLITGADGEVPRLFLDFNVSTVPDRPRSARLNGLRKSFREIKPDVVHSQLTVANFFGTIAAVVEKVAVRIITYLSLDLDKPLKYRAFDWTAARFASAVMVNSKATAAVIKKRLRVGDGKIFVIYNGFDTERFSPANVSKCNGRLRTELKIPDGAPVIGCVANLTPVKDHATLLRAFAEVRNRTSSKRPYLLLVGDGPERGNLEALAGSLGIERYTRFAGSVPDVERYYAAIDIFTLTSLEEGFSNVTVEAMLSGLPCIVTDFGPARELIEDGVSGYITPLRDYNSIADRLISLLNDSGGTYEVKRRCRIKAVDRFSVNRFVTETVDMYLSLINGRRGFEEGFTEAGEYKKAA